MQILASCTVSGTGASTDNSAWQMQLVNCGLNPCDDYFYYGFNDPKYETTLINAGE